MAITFTNLGASADPPDINSGTNATSYSSASWTPPSAGIVLVFVTSREASGAGGDPDTVQQNGVNLTQIGASIVFNNENGMSAWAAYASALSTGVLTIAFPATQTHCTAPVMQIEGADESGAVDAAFIGVSGDDSVYSASGTGTSSSVTLDAASDSDNRPVACNWHKFNEVTTERTNWTELDDLAGAGQNRGINTQVRTDTFETTASATWTTSQDFGILAMEVKIASGAPPALLAGSLALMGAGR